MHPEETWTSKQIVCVIKSALCSRASRTLTARTASVFIGIASYGAGFKHTVYVIRDITGETTAKPYTFDDRIVNMFRQFVVCHTEIVDVMDNNRVIYAERPISDWNTESYLQKLGSAHILGGTRRDSITIAVSHFADGYGDHSDVKCRHGTGFVEKHIALCTVGPDLRQVFLNTAVRAGQRHVVAPWSQTLAQMK